MCAVCAVCAVTSLPSLNHLEDQARSGLGRPLVTITTFCACVSRLAGCEQEALRRELGRYSCSAAARAMTACPQPCSCTTVLYESCARCHPFMTRVMESITSSSVAAQRVHPPAPALKNSNTCRLLQLLRDRLEQICPVLHHGLRIIAADMPFASRVRLGVSSTAALGSPTTRILVHSNACMHTRPLPLQQADRLEHTFIHYMYVLQ